MQGHAYPRSFVTSIHRCVSASLHQLRALRSYQELTVLIREVRVWRYSTLCLIRKVPNQNDLNCPHCAGNRYTACIIIQKGIQRDILNRRPLKCCFQTSPFYFYTRICLVTMQYQSFFPTHRNSPPLKLQTITWWIRRHFDSSSGVSVKFQGFLEPDILYIIVWDISCLSIAKIV